MRWDNQRVSADQPALFGLDGLVRSVRAPEFNGVVFHEVRAKSVLNRVTRSSSMPFQWTVNPYRGCSHACSYCLAGDTPILMADGRTKPLAELQIGDEIYGTQLQGNYRRYVRTRVLAHWSTTKPAYRVTLEDGTQLVTSGDHRFLTERGWKHVIGAEQGVFRRPHLTTGNKLMGTGRFEEGPVDTEEYRLGYLCGMIRGDAHLARHYVKERFRRAAGYVYRFRLALADFEALDRTSDYLTSFGIDTDKFRYSPATPVRREMMAIRTSRRADFERLTKLVEWPVVASEEWLKGFLAGIFDAEGSYSGGILRISNTDALILSNIGLALKKFDLPYVVEDYGRANRLRVVRIIGGLSQCLRFMHMVNPAITRKWDIAGRAVKSTAKLGVVSIESLRLELPLFDITTGTGDFIASGVISHNCFARNSHTYLDFDSGNDFNTQVVVKINAPELLAIKLASPRWQREHVAMGTNTDPYQRAEGRYQLMPGIISALADSSTPFSILTKGTVLSRDLPLLTAASEQVSVGVAVSIALLDRELQRTLEPGTPSPQARLELVRKIREAGLPCGVFVAPVLPWLTDSVDQLDGLLAGIADAGATGVTVLPLHLRTGAREWFGQWLQAEHPDLVPGYRRLYGKGSYVDRHYRQWLAARVRPLIRRHGLERGQRLVDHDPDGEGTWPRGSLTTNLNAPTAQLDQEQLTLL